MFKQYDTSKLTLELRELIESENPVDIWNFEYPAYYKGDDKSAFEKKVIDHFYFRQIGFETVGRFLHYFRAKIREIMPYYLQLYRTVEIMNNIDDPFGNVDITETFEQETHTTSSSDTSDNLTTENTNNVSVNSNDSQTINGTKDSKFSDTPQGNVSNLNDYLTTYQKDTDNNTSINEGNSTTSSGGNSSSLSVSNNQSLNDGSIRHTFTKKGNQGVNTYAHDMIEYRQSLIEVDMMIINDLDCLFLKIY